VLAAVGPKLSARGAPSPRVALQRGPGDDDDEGGGEHDDDDGDCVHAATSCLFVLFRMFAISMEGSAYKAHSTKTSVAPAIAASRRLLVIS